MQEDHEVRDIYAVTDSVSDAQFEAAIGEARAEGNLSRSNVVRKLLSDDRSPKGAAQRRLRISDLAARGYRSSQIAREVGIDERTVRDIGRRYKIDIAADRVVGKSRRLDTNRIVRELVSDLEMVETTVALIDVNELDRKEIQGWVDSLGQSLRVLTNLRSTLRKAL